MGFGNDNAQAWLGVRAQGDPAEFAGFHVIADVQAEGITVKRDGCLGIVDGDMCVLK